MWNGSSWAQIPLQSALAPTMYAVYADTSDLYIGGTFTGTIYGSAVNTFTNTGTAIAYPKFSLYHADGTAVRLVYIKNETTGATLWFGGDYWIQQGETITEKLGFLRFLPATRGKFCKYPG